MSSGKTSGIDSAGSSTLIHSGSSSIGSGGSSFVSGGGDSIIGIGGTCPPIPPAEEPDPEEEVPYASRVDFISDNELYRAEADPGTADSEPKWRIRKIAIATDDDVTTTWANGSSSFVHVWDDRFIYLYT
jgi:hypothetical protein